MKITGSRCRFRSPFSLDHELGHVLREWLEQPDAGPAAPELAPKQVWYSTLEHRVVRTVVGRPSRLDHTHPDASVVQHGSLGIVDFLVSKSSGGWLGCGGEDVTTQGRAAGSR